jgi:hypothetical protein
MRLDEQDWILVQYIIRDGAVLWLPVFAYDGEDYKTELPVYDQIMQTFEIRTLKDQ